MLIVHSVLSRHLLAVVAVGKLDDVLAGLEHLLCAEDRLVLDVVQGVLLLLLSSFGSLGHLLFFFGVTGCVGDALG